LEQIYRFDHHQFEAKFSVRLFVNPFKARHFLETDPARFCRSDETEVSDEQNTLFKD
jgi:hypothetical protein